MPCCPDTEWSWHKGTIAGSPTARGGFRLFTVNTEGSLKKKKKDGRGRGGLLRSSTGKVWSRHTGNVREQPGI